MTIEEIYKLIEEIEKDNKEYEKLVQERKNKLAIKRKKQEILKRIRILLTYVPLSLTGLFTLSNYIDNIQNNIYNGNNLKITKEQSEQIKAKIEEELNITIKEEALEYDLILNALLENKNLTEEQKKESSKILLKIIENNPYIKKEVTYQSLRKLNIIHKERPNNIDESIMGKYDYSEYLNYIQSIIYIYDEERLDNILEHELIHCILMNFGNNNFPRFLTEGLTEQITIENFSDNPYIATECYPYEIVATKLLCEILTKDTVLKSYTIGDINIIYKELEEITPDINSRKFIKEIEKVITQFGNQQKPQPSNIYQLRNAFLKYFILSKKEKDYSSFASNLQLFDTLMEELPYHEYLNRVEEGKYTKKTYFKKK